MDYLIKTTSCEEIQNITGEELRIIKQWKKGTRRVPAAASKLLRLCFDGDASVLLGPDWKNHIFRNNLLFIPEWRRGLSAQDIRSMYWETQLAASLKREISLLKSEIERRNQDIDRLETKAEFYRM
ncbi:hypothetical protein ABF87_13880 [Nitrosomonas sp. JL21]|uniref:hypothetical protein n=1 Tax=Nitrosomonas sp. JL21 TaxID=153949 RepID=UPI00136CD6C3|nr:hypothetical protein [Nitrosomonas sp. JL21]MBL8498658.1 hypothetical protein [Nitrosomonas sp.]MXS79028.1 hypothetical protein [Nitrosomonas sp. JL21]